MTIILIKFIICTIIVVIAGYYLSYAADIVADNKGVSKTWLGIALLASITSLPELVTCISASRSPDLAIGNIFGSNALNLTIIGIMDIVNNGKSIFGIIRIGHILNAGIGLFVTGIAVGGIIFRSFFSNSFSFLNIGVENFFILTVYFAGMKILFNYEKNKELSDVEENNRRISEKPSLIKEYTIICMSGGIVIFSGIWLAYLGDEFAVISGLGKTFVGSIFLAFATSLPEIVVCLSAVKLKSLDLGVGNLLGSCFFNLAIIPVLDVVYTKNTILSSILSFHILMAALYVILVSIIIISVTFKAKHSTSNGKWDTYLILFTYLAGSYFLFKITGK